MALLEGGKRLQLDCGRVYFDKDGVAYGSVTQTLKGFKPKVSQWAGWQAKLGTLCHLDISRRYKDQPIEELFFYDVQQAEIFAGLRNFRRMWSAIKIPVDSVIAVEMALSFKGEGKDEGVRYAGTGDIVFEREGLTYFGDIKTGNYYDTYPLQMAAYYQAAKELYEIDKIVILQCDVNLERNPERKPQLYIYDPEEMVPYVAQFNIMSKQYNKLLEAWIKVYQEDVENV